jgi:hypothetical protein
MLQIVLSFLNWGTDESFPDTMSLDFLFVVST